MIPQPRRPQHESLQSRKKWQQLKRHLKCTFTPLYFHFTLISEQLFIFIQNNHFCDSTSPRILFWSAQKLQNIEDVIFHDTEQKHQLPCVFHKPDHITWRTNDFITTLPIEHRLQSEWATALTVTLPHMRCTAIWSQGETWFATSTLEFLSLTSVFSCFTTMPKTMHKERNTKL
jgi:hypothetical protein